nr:RNA-directed DNA polymerase, eukaryota [Tanacetum cinerariifolium]
MNPSSSWGFWGVDLGVNGIMKDLGVSVAKKLGAPLSVVSFRRGVRDGIERQQWSDMVSLVGSATLSPSKDRWSCELSGNGAFKVKVVRNLLDDMFLPFQPVATR